VTLGFMASMGIPLLVIVAVIGAAFGLWFWWACTVPSSQFFPSLVRGPKEGNRVCLTFDDGPTSPYTEQILDILRERNVRATFFVCGKNVERAPQIVRRIVAEGHALGNHTYSHLVVYFRSRATLAEEIDRTQQVIERVTGYRPSVFRPPYGARWFGLLPVLRERGMHLVQWSDTGYDWLDGTEGIVRATLKHLRPGSVILLHDGRETRPPGEVDRSGTVQALPAIIDGVRKMGLDFTTVPEFLSS
jgi:peptidoglycan/xylan/chitin deacetylase (PgdA/CDA1 family)